MKSPKAPAPPDPKDTAQAQTGTNIGTAIANTTMGMVDQNTPYGSLSYEQTGTYQYTDPYTGQTYDLPTYTATTQLNDQQQLTLDQSQQAETNLATIANNQSDFLIDYLSEPADLLNEDVEANLVDLASRRVTPRVEQERAALETRLANQGLMPGSAAWDAEMRRFGETANDAYNQIYLQGRSQALNEAVTERNQPINEITALLTGSQVENPTVAMYTPQGAATTDVAGLINTNYNQRYGNWQNQMGQRNNIMGGLFGLGASAITGGLF